MTDHVCPRCGAGHSSRPDPDYEDAMSAAAKLCPREPTREMIEAAGNVRPRERWEYTVGDYWRAMYDAAPAPAADDTGDWCCPNCGCNWPSAKYGRCDQCPATAAFIANPFPKQEPNLEASNVFAERLVAAAPSAEPCPIHDSDISGRGACTCYDVAAPSAGAGDDHARGCEGRTYTCTCGYDGQRDAELARLRTESEQLREELVDKQRGINWNVARAEQAEAERDAANLRDQDTLRTCQYWIGEYNNCVAERDAAAAEVARLTIINDNHSECALIYTRENDELTDQRDAAVARAERLQDCVRHLLPMAKGWACIHPVGQNELIVADAAAILDAVRAGTADKGSGK